MGGVYVTLKWRQFSSFWLIVFIYGRWCTTVQLFEVSKRQKIYIYIYMLFRNYSEIIVFSKDALNVSKVTVKMIIMYNKCIMNVVLLNFHQRILSKYVSWSKYLAAQLFSALIIWINVSWAENQHIRCLKDHVTLKSGVMTISFGIRIHLILKILTNYFKF